MSFIYCLFFGAGVAGFAYSKMSRRLGYGNTQSTTIVVAVIFVLSTLFFYTIVRFFVPSN